MEHSEKPSGPVFLTRPSREASMAPAESFRCPVCGKNFKRQRDLTGRHLNAHKEEYLFLCPICDASEPHVHQFRRKDNLKSHLMFWHEMSSEDVAQYICPTGTNEAGSDRLVAESQPRSLPPAADIESQSSIASGSLRSTGPRRWSTTTISDLHSRAAIRRRRRRREGEREDPQEEEGSTGYPAPVPPGPPPSCHDIKGPMQEGVQPPRPIGLEDAYQYDPRRPSARAREKRREELCSNHATEADSSMPDVNDIPRTGFPALHSNPAPVFQQDLRSPPNLYSDPYEAASHPPSAKARGKRRQESAPALPTGMNPGVSDFNDFLQGGYSPLPNSAFAPAPWKQPPAGYDISESRLLIHELNASSEPSYDRQSIRSPTYESVFDDDGDCTLDLDPDAPSHHLYAARPFSFPSAESETATRTAGRCRHKDLSRPRDTDTSIGDMFERQAASHAARGCISSSSSSGLQSDESDGARQARLPYRAKCLSRLSSEAAETQTRRQEARPTRGEALTEREAREGGRSSSAALNSPYDKSQEDGPSRRFRIAGLGSQPWTPLSPSRQPRLRRARRKATAEWPGGP